MKLLDYVQPVINVARSVNLERDLNNLYFATEYHITAKTLQVLDRFADALKGERVTAWSLTGPYGMGKSAFVNFLLTITRPANNWTKRMLLKVKEANDLTYSNLSEGMKKVAGKKGFFQIFVTANYESVNHSVARGIKQALEKGNFGFKDTLIKLQKLQKEKVINTQELLAIIEELRSVLKLPFIIVIDEFGKNLEFMSHHQNSGDIFIMQRLAEMESTYLWVCLHQAFDEYIAGLSHLRKQEWSKIQGRFEDISFVESDNQMLYLIRKTLRNSFPLIQQKYLEQWAIEAKNFLDDLNIAEDLKRELSIEKIKSLYPIHPLGALILIQLCRRFAQNDRTLLSFLCSGDQFALPAYLKKTDINNPLPSIGLEHFYDYFFSVNTSIYAQTVEAQKWIQIQDIIDSQINMLPEEEALLKNIAILNLIGNYIGVRATPKIVNMLVSQSRGLSSTKINNIIQKFQDLKVLHFRGYADEYRLWEGTDFDIPGELSVIKSKLAINELDIILEQYLSLTPLIAPKHSLMTGTIRRYERRWLDIEKITPEIKPLPRYDGLILYIFGTDNILNNIPKICSDGKPLVIVYCNNKMAMHEYALEAAANRYLLENANELQYDAVARREVKHRARIAERAFRTYIEKSFSPTNDELKWYAQGQPLQISNSKDLSNLLSLLCDETFNACPAIKNEMISYENITSAAAAARRLLVEAMITNSEQEQLGLKGFGPEVAVYRSLIRSNGLHVIDPETKKWAFTLESQDPKINGLWKKIDSLIDSSEKGINVIEILQELQKPPFGLRMGPAPIFLCLYIIAKADDIAVFQEGNYKPYLSASAMSLMLKRPDLFELRRFIKNGINLKVFHVYHKLLKASAFSDKEGLRNASMLGVIGPLVKLIEQLPPYAKKTRNISSEAIKLRLTLQNSTDPIKLLFEEIPEAVGVDIQEQTSKLDWEDKLHERIYIALKELNEAFHQLELKVQNTILNVYGYKDLAELYKKEKERAKSLISICEEPELKAVLTAFSKEYEDLTKWVRGIAGLIIKKPVDSWNDSDFYPFEYKLKDFAFRTKQLELLKVSGSGQRSGYRHIYLMDTWGKTIIIKPQDIENMKLRAKINELLDLPKEKIEAILAALAYNIIEDVEK